MTVNANSRALPVILPVRCGAPRGWHRGTKVNNPVTGLKEVSTRRQQLQLLVLSRVFPKKAVHGSHAP